MHFAAETPWKKNPIDSLAMRGRRKLLTAKYGTKRRGEGKEGEGKKERGKKEQRRKWQVDVPSNVGSRSMQTIEK